MVLLNTHGQTKDRLEFRYFLDIPHSKSTFCSAREMESGKARLFLANYEDGRIYKRNGDKGTWEELSTQEYLFVRDLIHKTLRDKSAPCYSASKSVSLN